jgi:hypothetical protein
VFKIIETKKARLCKAYRCTNDHSKKDRFCSKHSKRYQKEKNEVSYVYNNAKSNAGRRKILFTLTLDEFKLFCKETNYLNLRGKKAGSASIDRVDPLKGYSYDNIQIMSLAENSAKMHKDNAVPF